jgi:hypothetical protein
MIYTVFGVLVITSGIVLSLVAWVGSDQDVQMGQVGMHRYTITKYGIWRSCFFSLALLMFGSLYTLYIDWSAGRFMVAIPGYVLREEVLAMDSILQVLEGHGGAEVEDRNAFHGDDVSEPMSIGGGKGPTIAISDHTLAGKA